MTTMHSSPARLTAREHEILQWVAAGKTDGQIATILGRSVRTVQKHLEHVYLKLGVENRTAAVMRVHAPQVIEQQRRFGSYSS